MTYNLCDLFGAPVLYQHGQKLLQELETDSNVPV